MLKNNKKGFALMEALVVTVFVAIVFAFLYINLIPIMSRYEAEDTYDTVDTKYVGNLIKNYFSYYRNVNCSPLYDVDEVDRLIKQNVDSVKYIDITESDTKVSVSGRNVDIYCSDDVKNRFEELKNIARIERVYITPLKLSQTKNAMKTSFGTSTDSVNKQLLAYVDYLPSFDDITSNAEYRLIFAVRDAYENDALYFGTIEYDF